MTEPTPSTSTAVAPAKPQRKLDLQAIGSTPVGGGAMFLPSTMQECVDFASIMSRSDFAIPPKFRNNPGACLAVTIQASRWQADPFGVIQKAYVTKSKGGDERLAYEAQLVAAIVNTRAPLSGRLSLTYSGEGHTRKVKVEGTFRDTGEVREITTPTVGGIKVKNSPLWESDPDQQLAYYGMRAWGRRWVPEILLGIYTPEELQEAEIIDAPRPARPAAAAVASSAPADEGVVRVAEEEPPVESGETVDEIIPDPPAEPEPPITRDEAAVIDKTRVPAQAGENRIDAAEEAGRLEEAANRSEELGRQVDEDAPSAELEAAVAYLERATEGLLDSELKTEADFDEYGDRTKAALKAWEGLTDDERDDLRARFVSAFLNRKRDAGFGRSRR